jgi:hypothetical protein
MRSARALAVMTGVVVAVSGCSGGAENESSSGTGAASSPEAVESSEGVAQPLQTTEADWDFVADIVDRKGMLSDGAVYRLSFPRRDLDVTSEDVRIAPGLALGSYAAFSRYADGTTMVMGDLVVTEEELPKVTDALQQAGLAQTAVHKHLLQQTPAIWWAHFHADSKEAGQLAAGVRAALDQTETPPSEPAAPAPELDLDTAGIDAALGSEGRNDGGIYKFSFARAEQVTTFCHPALMTGVNMVDAALAPIVDLLDDVAFVLVAAAGRDATARVAGVSKGERRR